jgi:tannase/feruloyl esterase
MPSEKWNGKLLVLGTGNFGGGLNYSGMAGRLRDGYATASTDTGHSGPAANTFVNDDVLTDFAYRAVHETTVAAKKTLDRFYGRRRSCPTSTAVRPADVKDSLPSTDTRTMVGHRDTTARAAGIFRRRHRADGERRVRRQAVHDPRWGTLWRRNRRGRCRCDPGRGVPVVAGARHQAWMTAYPRRWSA